MNNATAGALPADNHYDTLGVSIRATAVEIQTAYRRRLHELRDRLVAGEAPPPEAFDRLRAAWKTLREPVTRAAYDAALGTQLFAAGATAFPTATGGDVAAATATRARHGATARDESLASDASPAYRFRFVGSGGEYFRIWIVNLLLSVLTLGIYSAWAKVRREQYFHRNLLLDDSGFDYHGKPIAILKGRLLAFGLLVILSVAEKLSPMAYGIVLLALLPVVPWLVVRAFRFRAHNTSYRGLRFSFDGSYRQALNVFIGYGLLTAITLGLCFPLWLRQQKKFMLDNLRYGSADFACAVGIWPFYRIFLVPFLALAAVVVGIAVATAGLAPQQARAAIAGAVAFGAAVFILAQLVLVPYVQVRTTNLVMNATRLGAHRLGSDLRVGGYLGVVATNWLLTIATVGLFWPWARVRLAAYRAAHSEFLAVGGLDDFVAGETRHAPAVGDEMAEMFDFDVGL